MIGRRSPRRSAPRSDDEDRFVAFVDEARPRLTRALTAQYGPEVGTDAVSEAMTYAWANWSRVQAMENAIGYLYRVAERVAFRQATRTRRRAEHEVSGEDIEVPWFDESPSAVASILGRLPARQRASVLLVHGYGYTYAQAAEVLDIPTTTLTNDVARAMATLRVERDANLRTSEDETGERYVHG